VPQHAFVLPSFGESVNKKQEAQKKQDEKQYTGSHNFQALAGEG